MVEESREGWWWWWMVAQVPGRSRQGWLWNARWRWEDSGVRRRVIGGRLGRRGGQEGGAQADVWSVRFVLPSGAAGWDGCGAVRSRRWFGGGAWEGGSGGCWIRLTGWSLAGCGAWPRVRSLDSGRMRAAGVNGDGRSGQGRKGTGMGRPGRSAVGCPSGGCGAVVLGSRLRWRVCRAWADVGVAARYGRGGWAASCWAGRVEVAAANGPLSWWWLVSRRLAGAGGGVEGGVVGAVADV